MPGGRPSKYDVKMVKRAVELMQEGASLHEVCWDIGICFETYNDWTNEKSPRFKPEFSEAIKKGKLASRGWWEAQGRRNLQNKDFNYTGWYMNMKNRHGWKDKQETEHSGGVKFVFKEEEKSGLDDQ